jgi:putative phosphoribosyl transferase
MLLNPRRTAIIGGLIVGGATAVFVALRLGISKYQLKFVNRSAAALMLVDVLKVRLGKVHSKDKKGMMDVIILGIPRGGVSIADIIARRLAADFGIIVVRKIAHPFNREQAIGSISEDGCVHMDDKQINRLQIPPGYIEKEKSNQMDEIHRKIGLYFGSTSITYSNMKDKTVIIVDDGAATGSTIIGALRYIGKLEPKHLIVAIPVVPRQIIRRLEKENRVDAVEFITSPAEEQFKTISQFYQDFSPFTDEQVNEIIKKRELSL